MERVDVEAGDRIQAITVRDGRIVYNRFIFDRLPFEAARRAAD